MSVYPLTGVIRPYAWGSRTAIANLQGRPAPSPGPEAELWLGAHPGDPSTVTAPGGTPVPLTEMIAADPAAILGEQVTTRFGARLPYLMKVLAADAPLSLQAHPDAAYAASAYAAQQADPELPRNYTDAHHKPEMLVALTPFEALCGFRAPEAAADDLSRLGLPALDQVVAALREGEKGLPDAVETLLTWPSAERPNLIAEAARAAGPGLVSDLAQHYPGDPGVLVALLLNHVRLTPGQAIWMPAGNLHAYLTGTGIEIMAASDNVLRGGLTPKRVDVGELLKVLVFETLTDPILYATQQSPSVTRWQVPIDDFELYRVTLNPNHPPTRLPAEGPRIVLAISGDTHVAADHGTPIELLPGAAAFAPAETGPLTLAGVGEVFVAAVGRL